MFTGDVVPSHSLKNIFITWLTEAVSRWEENFNPNPAVLTLALNLSVYLAPDEKIFVQLSKQNAFQRFIRLIKKALSEMQASPNIGYIKLISSFLKHKSGCQWVISSSHWSEIILLTLSSSDDQDFAQAGYNFISKFIANSARINLEFCSKVINLMISPIIDIANPPNNVSNSSIFQNRQSTFNLLSVVLESLLEERQVNVFDTVVKVVNARNFEVHLSDLLIKISDENIRFSITIILYLIGLYRLVVEQNKLHLNYLPYEVFLKLIKNTADIVEGIVRNGAIDIFIKLCAASQVFYVKLKHFSPRIKTKDNVITSLQEQSMLCVLYPCAYLSYKLFGWDFYENCEDDIRNYNISRTMTRALPLTIRFVFFIRPMFEMNFSLHNSATSLKQFLSIRQHVVNKESKGLCLRMLIFFFEDISIAIKTQSKNILDLPGHDAYIATLMETIAILLKEFDVNWQENFETMKLLELTSTILDFQTWEKEVSRRKKNVILTS